MELRPKRVKYRKEMRGTNKGNAGRGNSVDFGEYGLQSLDHGWIPGRQIEAARIAANHYMGGEGKIWISVMHTLNSGKSVEEKIDLPSDTLATMHLTEDNVVMGDIIVT